MSIDGSTAGLTTPLPRRLPFPEATALFNPALGAIIMSAAAAGHVEESGSGLPWLASFLITPLVLHDPTRASLPRDVRTSMATWLSRNPIIRDDFGRHANVLAPITRGAIRFAIRSGMMSLSVGHLIPIAPIRGISSSRGVGVRAYYVAARLSGRWMAKLDVLTAYSLLGVKL
jgi:hypothetical protein